MSDFLDKEDQINAFIRAMNARTALSRPTPVSQASFSAAPPQAVILTPPTETEEDVLDEDESEDSILEGGMQLTSEGWNADTPTAVDTEEERDQALEQVRSAMTETQINHQDLGRTFSTAVTPDAVSSSNSNVGSSPTQESTSTRPRGHTTASSSTIVSGVRPPPPTPQMAAQTDFSTDSHTGDAVQTILGAFASSSPHNLADSIHAPHHVRTNENGNRPILLSSIHKVMEENRSKQLATVYETDPHTGHNAPSKIDDNASAFIAAMNAKMNPSKAKSSGSSAKTVSSDSTVTAASTLSTVTVKNQENKPFGKEEARGLLTSPMKRTFNESHEEVKPSAAMAEPMNDDQVNDVEAPVTTPSEAAPSSRLTAEALHAQAQLQEEEAAQIKEEQEFEARKASIEVQRAALDAAFARMEEEHKAKRRSAPAPAPQVEAVAPAAPVEAVVPGGQVKEPTIKHAPVPVAQVHQAPTLSATLKGPPTKKAPLQAAPALVAPTASPAKSKASNRSSSLSFVPATEVVENLKIPEVAAGAANRATTQDEDQDNRENQVYFSSWGTAAKGDRASRPTARRRKVTLSQLPPDITLKQVASILFNGAIDTFSIVRSTVDSSVAEAIFATGDGCKAYYDATPNGLNMKLKEKIYSIMVDIDLHVAPVSSQLQEWLDKGVTRCVRAVGVDEQWTIPALWRVAEGTKRALRKVEHVVDSKNPAGTRIVTFRFTNIADAVQFRGVLARDEDWEGCNIFFSADPCAEATKMHLD